MSSGKPSTPMGRHLKWLSIGAAVLWLLTSTCIAQTGSVDQIERLLQLQQALQQQHAQQLSSIQLQLQEQERASVAQDWQWVMVCALGLMALCVAAWAAKLWQARKAVQSTQVRPTQDHLHGMLFAPPVIDTAEPAFGSLKRKADIDTEDDLDSQMLADEALREFELRRTVGLIPEAQAEPPAIQAPPQTHLEQAWADMQEVSLEADTPPEDLNTGSSALDVSIEVQKVRKMLQLRRMERSQVTALATFAASSSPIISEALPPEETEFSSSPELDVVLEEEPETDMTVVAPEPTITSMPAPPSTALTLSESNKSRAELIFPASQRGMSEMEVRLALAQEFRRLGQIEEAEQLCTEALHAGNAAEQRSARQLLESLPGR